jgi:arginase family enzyme
MSQAGGTTVQAANTAVQAARPRRLVVLGAATSAGTHHAGQERAPEALRAAGFVQRLEAAGLAVTDLGDVVRETFRVDRSGAPARSEAAVVRTAGAVADAVERVAARRTAAGQTAGEEAVAAARGLIVHFDVDAVDSGDLPLANFPHYGTGVPLSAARRVLSVLFAAPRLSAVVLTEVNPGYDPDGDSLARYTEAVAGALAAGLTGR